MIGVYKIVNTITGDYYIGSSINVERRWGEHRKPSVWKSKHNQLYIDMQKYGREKFVIEVIEELSDADIKTLHSREQYWIEQLHPVYNMLAAYTGIDKKQYNQQYYSQHTVEAKQYYSQYCNYNGEILTLGALGMRFKRRGIEHPTIEAKKYLVG